MRKFLFIALMLAPVVAQAETQASVDSKVKKVVARTGISGAELTYLIGHLLNPKKYETAVELLAAAPDDGTIGYAIDTDVTYFRQAGSWVSTATLAALANGATWTNAVDGTTTLTEGGETEQHIVTNNLITLNSSTSAAYAIATALGITGVTTATGAIYANGGVDRSSAAALAIGGANATSVVITPATTITGLATATGGLSTTKPLFVYSSVRFCGNGSNGTTPWYDGPVLESAFGADMSIGSAGCDGLDSATEATADFPLDAIVTRKIVGMRCSTEAGGAADTNTFQLRSAAASVTGVTCAVTNDGALPKTCTVILAAPVTITAGATLAVQNVQSGTDNMSAKDMECVAFYTN